MQAEAATHRCVALHPGPSRCSSLARTPHYVEDHTRHAHTEHRHISTSPLYSVNSATLAQYPGNLPYAAGGAVLRERV